jgi:hypothetical protein
MPACGTKCMGTQSRLARSGGVRVYPLLGLHDATLAPSHPGLVPGFVFELLFITSRHLTLAAASLWVIRRLHEGHGKKPRPARPFVSSLERAPRHNGTP